MIDPTKISEPVPAAPVEAVAPVAPLAPAVEKVLGLPVDPVPAPEKAGYVDTSKLSPKAEGYAADTPDKQFFDFIQDRYRSGSLGVAPGYNFYSDSPLYNPELVQKYKERYPEIAAQFAANPDAKSYQPTTGNKTENKHELAPFWDYAAGRQEKDDLKNLYMYGFKADDPNATPEIMQRLKDENPWLWEEYQKNLAAGQTAGEVPKNPEVPPTGEEQKPVGANGNGQTAKIETKQLPDIIGMLGKFGYSALEILQAGMAGGAGITDFNQTSAGRRVLKEAEDKAAEAKKAETAEERAFQERLFNLQDEAENKRLMSTQEFQKMSQASQWTQDEKMAIANQARDLEKMGYDRETSLMIAAEQNKGLKSAAGTMAGTDPFGIKGMDTLDALFTQGKITAAEYEKQKGALVGKQAAVDDMAAKLGSQDAAQMIVGNQKPSAPKPETIPGTNIPKAQGNALQDFMNKPAPLPISQQVAAAPSKAEKQKLLMQAGYKEVTAGIWQGPAQNGKPGEVIKL